MVNFPSSFDTDSTLYVAVNNLRTTLSAPGVDDLVTVIPVATTSGFPSTGFITILTGADITDAEAIAYTGTTSNSFTGCTRGAGGTPANSHNAGDNVDLTIVAAHHNELKDAIINLEYFVGVSGSEAWPTTLQDVYDNGDGSILLADNPIVISGSPGVFFNTNYVHVSGTLDTQSVIPHTQNLYDLGSSTNAFRAVYLDNDGGDAVVFESAPSKSSATSYTFNLGGGDSGGVGYLNDFTFKMEDMALSTNGQNSIIFDTGASSILGSGANRVKFVSNMSTAGDLTLEMIFYSIAGGQGNDIGLKLSNPNSSIGLAYNLVFDNNTEPGDFSHSGFSSKQIKFQFDSNNVGVFDINNSTSALFRISNYNHANHLLTGNNFGLFSVGGAPGVTMGNANTTWASAWIEEPRISLNGYTLTNAASLYVPDAPTEGTAINAAIWAPVGWTILDRMQAVSGTYSTSLTVSGEPVLAGDSISVSSGAFATSLTVSGEPVYAGPSIDVATSLTVSGVPVVTEITFPKKGTLSFTTPSVAGTGGTQTGSETGFAKRALVRKLVVTPSSPSLMISTTIEFFHTNSYLEADLEYKATSSGTFTDNDTWFHEDEDGTSSLHWKITNDSATAGTYDIDITQEEFA